MNQTAFRLVNPQNNSLALEIFTFEDDSYFSDLKSQSYYSLILVTEGKGKLRADYAEYRFEASNLMTFSMNQSFLIEAETTFKGLQLNFHPDFFCIYKHQQEVACNGVLFNNIYESPVTRLEPNELENLLDLVNQLRTEMQNVAVAQYELLTSYLKILLINASRIKMNQQASGTFLLEKEPFILQTLKDAIEAHYKTKRSASDYADLLNISTKALNRITKNHCNKTLTNLIAERVIIEAKRELFQTLKPVKTIAYELGFQDEFYFSRYFKTNTAISPQLFRNTISFAPGEETGIS